MESNLKGPLLKTLSYYETGGKAEHFHAPKSLNELSEIRKKIQTSNKPYFILGAGSNSLVMDEGFPGHVISLHELNKIVVSKQSISAEAGAINSDITRIALKHRLEGLSWMHCLPGQIGATVRMNARCYGGEISGVVTKIETIAPDGKICVFDNTKDKVFAGYKDTIFMRNHHVVARVHFDLSIGDKANIKSAMDACEKDRKAKGQFDYPSCGCVFKNDYSVGVPSGMLLDAAGAHELKHERLLINPHHANFLFNKNHASSRDILEMTLKMRNLVYDEFGVWLAYEMEILGQIPDDLKVAIDEIKTPKPIESKIEPLRRKFHKKSL
jgi:UDP-N-acetylmuramate dehydrogenase